jgi:N-acetylglucosamine kinase-like BadF-type ATPase
MNRFYIGMDGGASRARAILLDDHDTIVAQSQIEGGLNPLAVGWESFRRNLQKLLDPLLAESPPAAELYLCAGIAGVGNEEMRSRAEEEIGAAYTFQLTRVITDAQAALWGAFRGGPGLLLIAGTGSICLGKNPQGQTARCGGFGRLLGDEGGGYWMAIQAIRRALHQFDRGADAPLADPILREFRLSRLTELPALVHSGELSPDRIARFAETILTESATNPEAEAIVRAAAGHLAQLAINTAEKLKMAQPALALWGGLWQSPGGELRRQLLEALEAARFTCRLTEPAEPPQRGAILFMRENMP